jgi:hypothetical protein
VDMLCCLFFFLCDVLRRNLNFNRWSQHLCWSPTTLLSLQCHLTSTPVFFPAPLKV